MNDILLNKVHPFDFMIDECDSFIELVSLATKYLGARMLVGRALSWIRVGSRVVVDRG